MTKNDGFRLVLQAQKNYRGLSFAMSISYLAIKHLHLTCVGLSGSLFLLRGFWRMRDSVLLNQRWVRIVPHLIDTLLLASALTLAVMSGQYPFQQNWLTAKLLALLLYIVLGTIALKRGKTPAIRTAAFVAAILTFAYIISVALSRQAIPL
ncbi:SirB2 family protein [Undibacterium sp. Di27W]